ncbi:MAG: hypothetical protein NT132_07700 [Microbacterium sp.]|uniref:hypothetical protein n=1 Tax=Microbacterium sp. TaxID=51671 RepID=UPI00260883BB|nr:hypothetical protein [Microbacterium sp.]MCX6502272.1 hypothetical protein [Microbacterium sp.]
MTTVTGSLARDPRMLPDEVGADIPRRILAPLDRPARRRRPRLAYGIVAVAGAVAIAAAQMLLSILSTQSSFEISSLTQHQKELTWQQQILYDEVAGLSSPQYLAANAAALGMVINESPSYLRLSDGAVLGSQLPSVASSSVDALGRSLVSNTLVTDTPLVTDPDATIDGLPVPATDATGAVDQGNAATPPALTDGLPSPATH